MATARVGHFDFGTNSSVRHARQCRMSETVRGLVRSEIIMHDHLRMTRRGASTSRCTRSDPWREVGCRYTPTSGLPVGGGAKCKHAVDFRALQQPAAFRGRSNQVVCDRVREVDGRCVKTHHRLTLPDHDGASRRTLPDHRSDLEWPRSPRRRSPPTPSSPSRSTPARSSSSWSRGQRAGPGSSVLKGA